MTCYSNTYDRGMLHANAKAVSETHHVGRVVPEDEPTTDTNQTATVPITARL